MQDTQMQELIDSVMLAGKIMIESGADMARVDDTLKRIARNGGIKEPKIFETTTGIMMSAPDYKLAQVEPIQKRTIDLEKVSRVNDISRAFQLKKITVEEMKVKLEFIDKKAPFFAWTWQVLAAAMISCTLMIMYNGHWQDFITTAVIGGLGYACYYFINTTFKIKFVSEFLASLVIGVLSVLAVRNNLGISVGMIIIGSVMPSVPGVPITNSVRDVLAGHLLSGLARGTEALLSASAIALGIAMVLRFM